MRSIPIQASSTRPPFAPTLALPRKRGRESRTLLPLLAGEGWDGGKLHVENCRPPTHRITSSARISIDSGIVSPSALAALRLTLST